MAIIRIMVTFNHNGVSSTVPVSLKKRRLVIVRPDAERLRCGLGGRNELSTSVDYRGCMRNRPAPKRAQRKIAKRGDLLCVWLDLLNHLDNPLQRRATKFRQTHRARRVIPGRRTSGEIRDPGTR